MIDFTEQFSEPRIVPLKSLQFALLQTVIWHSMRIEGAIVDQRVPYFRVTPLLDRE